MSSVRELLHLIVDAGSVVYYYNLQDRIILIEILRNVKGCKNSSKSDASQSRLCKS